ncbi:Transposon Ty3-G Gag-Pol polyprotein [Smittium culicis]|uniref:Transposon Ty3-G Gag-Pol polyprotein n=1 Tax=Smittium culicis TaxID=133412 RepID=A0A1R1YBB1_9FUNG|nr:Transposon Ty3-G Gag-Pol polyprotein [Smittium culicis]
MLEAGIITNNISEWLSPILLAPKINGGHRFCVGYRNINKLVPRDKYPLPRIDECVEKLRNNPKSRKYKAFLSQFGNY